MHNKNAYNLFFSANRAIFVLLLRFAAKLLKDPLSSDLTKSLALGLIAATFAFVFQGFLGTYFEVRTLASYYWILAGLMAASAKYENEDITN